MKTRMSRRTRTLLAGGGGLALFAATLYAADAAHIGTRVGHLGIGFAWLLLLAGVRLAARAAGWTICAGGSDRLPFRAAFAACVAGEGAGNVTPLGLAASEPAKVMWVRPYLDTVSAASALAAETLIYSAATALVLLAGSVAMGLALAPAARIPILVTGGAVLLTMAAGTVAVRRHPRVPFRRILRWVREKAEGGTRLGAVALGVRRTGGTLRSLTTRHPRRLAAVCALQLVFQAAAVAEVWLALMLLRAAHHGLGDAFLLEYTNRAVTVVFKFVPMRLGVDELASGLTASVLGATASIGVALALVRKARVACWSLVGALLVAARLLSGRARADEVGKISILSRSD